MNENPGILLTVIAFLLVIGPLVFIHEFGHYFAGRIFGVKADAFSIGMGKELFHWIDRRGTRWRLAALPIGGYVKFAGDMNPASQPSREWLSLPAEERERTFNAKPVWQRAIIVAAGPFINFLFAIVILGAFAVAYGESVTPPVVRTFEAGSPAISAGLQPGDRITALNGEGIDTFEDLAEEVRMIPGADVTLTIRRDGEDMRLPVTIGETREIDRFGNSYSFGRLGVYSVAPQMRDVPLWRAPMVGLERTGDIVTMMVDTLGQIVTGRRSVQELGGPLKIAQVSAEFAVRGAADFLFLLALISINLGFINLLPIPMLDGGHLMFYAVEAVQRRPVGARAQEWAFRSGLALLLAVMIFATINDLSSFGLFRGLSRLIG